MHRVVVRTLSRELRLQTDSDEAFAVLSYVGADPRMPDADRTIVDVTVDRVGAFYRIAPPGHGVTEGSAETILNAVFRLLSGWFFEDTRGTPALHAAAATLDGGRFAFLGDKGFGKTTLMLKLIEQGAQVEGDEHIVVTGKGAITRPRRLHVKETSLPVVPALAEAICASPCLTDWMGNRIFACAPSDLGGAWEIAERPVDHLIFVEPNFGGSSVVSPLPLEESFSRLMERAFMPQAGVGAAAARLRVLSLGAKAWKLQAGNLDQAVWHLRKLAHRE